MTPAPPGKSTLSGEMGSLALSVAMATVSVPCSLAQDATDWQVKAGGRMSFDVASVKRTKIPRIPNFGLAPDDAKPHGSRLSAVFPLNAYIGFAYKLAPFQTG